MSEPSKEANLINCMDAKIWAEEFCRIRPNIDIGTMIGWFANAIMSGYDNAKRGQDAAVTAALKDAITKAAQDGELIGLLTAQRDRLREAALAYQELATCYRIGKRPTEKLFKRLERASSALKEEA